MRRLFVTLMAVLFLAEPLASLAASTDQEKFQGKVERYTNQSSFDNPKRLCVCIDDDNPEDERMAGVLVDTLVTGGDGARRIQVRCFVRRFTANGTNTTSEACTSTWAPLR